MRSMPPVVALETDFDEPGEVSEVYREPLPHDGDDEFNEPLPDIVDMIEEEFCPLADQRYEPTHIYLDGANSCARCGMPAPWVMRNQCRQL